jgi:acetyl-CoA acetyltransferase
MHKYGTSEQQMSLAAVKNHGHGALNPKAHLQKEITYGAERARFLGYSSRSFSSKGYVL